MREKYLSRAFNVSATAGNEVTATLLIPYKSAEIVGIELSGDAFQTAGDPEVFFQVSLSPTVFQNGQAYDGMLAYVIMGGTRTTDVGLARLDFAKNFRIPNVPIAIGQSIYFICNASACNAGAVALVWFRVIRQ